MLNKKSIRCLMGAILTVSLLCTGCGTRENSSHVSKNNEFNSTAVEDELEKHSDTLLKDKSDVKEDTFSVPIDTQSKQKEESEYLPKVEEVVPYNYYYLCYSMEEAQKQEYKKDLKAKGLEQIKQETVSDVIYECYADAKKRILIVDIKNALVVSIANVYDGMETEENDYTLEMINSLVQEEYNRQLDNKDSLISNDYPPRVLIKCWIPELYDKTKIQAYQTLSSDGKNTGIYLISDDRACRIMDSLENICIADIDNNGTSELLSLYGFGSGIWRIHLNVYQYSNPIELNGLKKLVHCCYHNCYVPKQGYGDLAFNKISDNEVHLVEMKQEIIEDGTNQEYQITYGKDYGKLVIDSNYINVELEKMDEFPFYEWDKHFTNSINSDENDTKNNEEQQLSNEVPKLTVNIGDTILQNFAWKEIWGEETEKQIPFCDIMKSGVDIPRFASPGFYKFTDEICLSFPDGIKPQTIKILDYLINEDGVELYHKAGVMEREIRYGEDGNYYIGLMAHMALYLSSNTSSYTNPSYRGFRVMCQFDEQHSCEYVFVLSLEPAR